MALKSELALESFLKENLTCVLIGYADYCQASQALFHYIGQVTIPVTAEFFDVVQCPKFVNKEDVRATPVILALRRGRIVDRRYGTFEAADIQSWLESSYGAS
jgi:hypothetical protein